METIDVLNWKDLLELLQSNFDRSHFIFRGAPNFKEHKLRPKIGRVIGGYQPYSERREKWLYERFKQYATIHLTVPTSSEWDFVALAQHHGLPTRLLDWTFNPLVAAWFGLEGRFLNIPKTVSHGPKKERGKNPAVVYARRLPDQVDKNALKSPMDVDRVMSLLPNHATRRITVQSGLFTVHNAPDKDWDDAETQAILLAFDEKEWRRATRHLLRFGVHRYALFPDLDGLSSHLSVLYTRHFSLQLADIAEPVDDEDER